MSVKKGFYASLVPSKKKEVKQLQAYYKKGKRWFKVKPVKGV